MRMFRRIRLEAAVLGLILLLPACYHHTVDLDGLTPQAYLAANRPDTVRVTVPDLGLRNRKVAFRGIEGDTLLFTADTTMQVAWGAVERLDILTGHGSNVWLGAGLGFLGGATVGLLIAAAAPQGEDREEVILYPAAGALLGTLLGTFVGLEGRTDRWGSVPLGGVRVGLDPGAGHVGITARLAF